MVTKARPPLTEVRATFGPYGTRVERIAHHTGCALDLEAVKAALLDVIAARGKST